MTSRPVFPGLGELPIEQPPPGFTARPRRYTCHRATGPIVIDGVLDDRAWKWAPCTEPFVNIRGPDGALAPYATRVMMLWDDDFLYVGADLEEPDVWGALTQRDSHIFNDNDFEVFIDPDCDGKRYVEVEINALNAVFDVLTDKPFSDGGLPDISFDVQGLLHAVHVDGTLNWSHDTDRGWSVEMAFPWRSLAALTAGPCPPRPGDEWRVAFGRVHWARERVGGDPLADCDMSVWAPQGAFNMHIPAKWGWVKFSDRIAEGR